jgi:hypothetical protein
MEDSMTYFSALGGPEAYEENSDFNEIYKDRIIQLQNEVEQLRARAEQAEAKAEKAHGLTIALANRYLPVGSMGQYFGTSPIDSGLARLINDAVAAHAAAIEKAKDSA